MAKQQKKYTHKVHSGSVFFTVLSNLLLAFIVISIKELLNILQLNSQRRTKVGWWNVVSYITDVVAVHNIEAR
jgi:uncharacterized membrane protein